MKSGHVMWLRSFFKVLLISLVPLVVYSTNLDGTWILDDHYQVEENPFIRSIQHVPRIFTTRLWQSTSEEMQGSDIYRPVFLLSYMADYHLFGLRPFWFHFVNNLLHAVNCLLLFLLGRKFLTPWIAALNTAIFAIHPIGVEAVTWIGGRMDLLVTFFALSNVHLALRILDSTQVTLVRTWLFYVLSIPLGLFSKETFALVPFLAPAAVLVANRGSRASKTRLLALAGVAGIVSAAAFLVRQQVLRREIGTLFSLDNLGNVTALLKRFAFLFFVPSDSDFFFAYAPAPFHWKTDIPPFLIVGLLIGFALWKWWRKRGFLLGVALFLAPLIPVALVADILGLISERYFYLPLAGCSLALGAQLESWNSVFSGDRKGGYRTVLAVLVGIWFLSLAGTTIVRNREWHDEVRLYTASKLRDSDSFLPHFFMAWHYTRSGDKELEIRNYLEAVRRNPDHLRSLNNLGVRFVEQGKFHQAEKVLHHALEVDAKRAKTSYNLGYLSESRGDRAGAEGWYRKALELDGSYTLAQSALARVSARK